MAKEQSEVNVAKRLLRDFFGLDEKVIKKVIQEIKSEGGYPELKTRMMRRRVGAQAMTLLNKALKSADDAISKNSGNEAKADEAPKEKEEPKKEEEVKESTFLKYLLSELNDEDAKTVVMDIDPQQIRDPKQKRDAMLAQRKQSQSKGAQARAIREKIKELQQRLQDLTSGA